MQLEIHQQKRTSAAGKPAWYWRTRAANGKITGNNEAFPSKGNAIRAAKAQTAAPIKEFCKLHDLELSTVAFTKPVWDDENECFVIRLGASW